MSASHKVFFLFLILAFLPFSAGCLPSKRARVAAVALTVDDVARAAARQTDPGIVEVGTPAYLMLIDGLIEAYPQNRQLLLAGCRAYGSYASSFLEDRERQQARALYGRARDYGFRALSKHGDFRRAVGGALDEFRSFLRQYKKKDVPALFWTVSAWAGWLNLNLADLEALAELPMLEATLRRLLELDETYYYGGPHLFMAVYLAARPPVVGGNLPRAREHFQRAMALGKGRLLMAKVLFARYYAVGIRDRALFEKTLKEVLAAPAAKVPELTLANLLAQKKARKLLEKADEYFPTLP